MRICVSCESTLDDEFMQEFDWDFDIDHTIWAQVPRKRRVEIPRDRIVGFRVNRPEGAILYDPSEVEIILKLGG